MGIKSVKWTGEALTDKSLMLYITVTTKDYVGLFNPKWVVKSRNLYVTVVETISKDELGDQVMYPCLSPVKDSDTGELLGYRDDAWGESQKAFAILCGQLGVPELTYLYGKDKKELLQMRVKLNQKLEGDDE